MRFKHSANRKPRWSASGRTTELTAQATATRLAPAGSAVVALLRDYMAPWLLGRDAAMVEEIWRGLFFYTHANSVGATVSLALAAVDIALWDLRCKRAHASLHLVAGGAQRRIPIYNTEGGWLNFTTEELVSNAVKARETGFRGFKVKVGQPHVAEGTVRIRTSAEGN
jgi:L-alanine-DL-glutamate epimerase-like enolase superfamily enzyme